MLAPMRVHRVVPDFQAPDPAAAGAFYGEVLGLEVAMDLGWIVTYADPQNHAAQISVVREDATAPVVPDVSVEVDDVDAAHAAAVRLGCEVVHPLTDEPWGVRRFFVREPTGRVLNVLGHRRAAAYGRAAAPRRITSSHPGACANTASRSPPSMSSR